MSPAHTSKIVHNWGRAGFGGGHVLQVSPALLPQIDNVCGRDRRFGRRVETSISSEAHGERGEERKREKASYTVPGYS
jgi:hypothetical protein